MRTSLYLETSYKHGRTKPQGALDNYFKITARGSTVRQEVLAGLTTFLAMVYSVIVVPGMQGKQVFLPQLCLLPPV